MQLTVRLSFMLKIVSPGKGHVADLYREIRTYVQHWHIVLYRETVLYISGWSIDANADYLSYNVACIELTCYFGLF